MRTGQHVGLVIAAQTNDFKRARALKPTELTDYGVAIWTAVDVIADQHNTHRAAIGVFTTPLDQFAKFIDMPMHVADCVGEQGFADHRCFGGLQNDIRISGLELNLGLGRKLTAKPIMRGQPSVSPRI